MRTLALIVNLVVLVGFMLDWFPFESAVVLLLGNALPWLIDPESKTRKRRSQRSVPEPVLWEHRR